MVDQDKNEFGNPGHTHILEELELSYGEEFFYLERWGAKEAARL